MVESLFLAYEVGRELEALGGLEGGEVINGGSGLADCDVCGDRGDSSCEAESWDF